MYLNAARQFTAPVCQGILNEVWKYKLIFVETPDANETSIALENYRRVRVRSTPLAPIPLVQGA